MTKAVLWRVDCQAGCGLVSAFTVQLDHADKKRLEERILSTAGWLRYDGSWACPGCSHAMRERIGVLSTKQERLLFDAIQNAIHWRKMQVGP